MEGYDAVVVGAGPNGLSAAATLATEGLSVLVVEAADTLGGGARTQELTLPGFRHDVCSAIHPLGVSSPVLERFRLEEHGLRWIHPDLPAAHPLDGGQAVLYHRSVDETAAGLGADGDAWRRIFGPLAEDWEMLRHQILGPVRFPRSNPLSILRFARYALRSFTGLADAQFAGIEAKSLLAGMAGHAFVPLGHPYSAAFGLLLGTAAHGRGWPMPEGGAQAIADALASYITSQGGEFRTGFRVRSLSSLPPSRLVMLDTSPHEAMRILDYRMPIVRRSQLGNFRPGPGVFKLDYALDGPIPWANPEVGRAGTVHVGGDIHEITAAEAEVAAGRHPENPFMLVVQHTRFDRSRAPEGKHTLWAYSHVPNGSTVDMRERMERQLERFAPGVRDRIIERHVMTPADVERHNPNNLGGDISGGANDRLQLFLRPRLALDPYFLSDRHGRAVYLCSASTPPGGAVHGMCGYHASRVALRRLQRGS